MGNSYDIGMYAICHGIYFKYYRYLGESENMLGHGLPQDMAILIGKMMISDGIGALYFETETTTGLSLLISEQSLDNFKQHMVNLSKKDWDSSSKEDVKLGFAPGDFSVTLQDPAATTRGLHFVGGLTSTPQKKRETQVNTGSSPLCLAQLLGFCW